MGQAPGLRANIPWIVMKRMKGTTKRAANMIFWPVMTWRVCLVYDMSCNYEVINGREVVLLTLI